MHNKFFIPILGALIIQNLVAQTFDVIPFFKRDSSEQYASQIDKENVTRCFGTENTLWQKVQLHFQARYAEVEDNSLPDQEAAQEWLKETWISLLGDDFQMISRPRTAAGRRGAETSETYYQRHLKALDPEMLFSSFLLGQTTEQPSPSHATARRVTITPGSPLERVLGSSQ